MGAPRVLLLHNRYRIEGGEERSVALQLAALERAGIPAGSLERPRRYGLLTWRRR